MYMVYILYTYINICGCVTLSCQQKKQTKIEQNRCDVKGNRRRQSEVHRFPNCCNACYSYGSMIGHTGFWHDIQTGTGQGGIMVGLLMDTTTVIFITGIVCHHLPTEYQNRQFVFVNSKYKKVKDFKYQIIKYQINKCQADITRCYNSNTNHIELPSF